jgi:hypothetical protein
MRREPMVLFTSRRAFLFAILFSAQFLVRTILDWFMPTLDFHTRATVSTFLSAAILLAAGFSAAWRSDSFSAGAVSGVVTAGVAAVISVTGAVILLMVWHDPETMAAIRGSGGLEEVFSLPVMMILPGVVLGSVGGVACIVIKRVFPHLS